MKKTILTIFALAAFVITGCNDTGKEPEPTPPPVEENPMEGAVYMLTSFVDETKKDINKGDRSFDQGKILTWMKDGTFSDDVFEKANPGKELGFSATSFSIRGNKAYIFSLTHPQTYEPRITVMDKNTLKIEKDIIFEVYKKEGSPYAPSGMTLISDKKAYVYYSDKISVIDLETGKELRTVTGLRDRYPLWVMRDNKSYGLYYDENAAQTSFVTVNTETDVINYTSLNKDIVFEVMMTDKEGNLIVLTKDFLSPDEFNFLKISPSGSILQERELGEDFKKTYGWRSAIHSPDEPVIFFQGTGETKKIIYKWNYETDKIEVFADLKTNQPNYDFYQMSLAIHPQTKELIVGVVDAIYTKWVRVYDSKATTLPVNHKREFAYNGKFRGIHGFAFNTNHKETTTEK